MGQTVQIQMLKKLINIFKEIKQVETTYIFYINP